MKSNPNPNNKTQLSLYSLTVGEDLNTIKLYCMKKIQIKKKKEAVPRARFLPRGRTLPIQEALDVVPLDAPKQKQKDVKEIHSKYSPTQISQEKPTN